MEFCPVLVKISEGVRSSFYADTGYQYLLQVWSKKNDKIYERPLLCKLISFNMLMCLEPVKNWNVFFDYLIYKPEAPDSNHEYIHLVNLTNNNSMILIKDFTQDPDCTFESFLLFVVVLLKFIIIYRSLLCIP